MVQVVLPALIPDIPKVYDVYFNAFQNDQMGKIMLEILFPGVIDEEFKKAHAAGTLAYWHTSGSQYTFKCVDTSTGEIIGMALGDVYLSERSEEERKNHGVPWLIGEQRERAEKILNPLWEVRERLFGGKRYICKSIYPCSVHIFSLSCWRCCMPSGTTFPLMTPELLFRLPRYRHRPEASRTQGRRLARAMGTGSGREGRPARLFRIIPFNSRLV